MFMHFKKCGSSDSELEEQHGFEHDDTDVMVRMLCAIEFGLPHSNT